MTFDNFWFVKTDTNTFSEDMPFGVFTPGHLIWVLITLAVIIICALCYVRGNNKTRANIRYIIALAMIFTEFWKISLCALKGVPPNEYLPLEVCSLGEYMILIDSMWPDNRITKQLLAFAFFPATVMALAFPTAIGYPSFGFIIIRFFVMHGGIAVYFVCRYAAGEIKPKYVGLWGSHLFFLGLAIIMHQFDVRNGLNYMFLTDPLGNPVLQLLWDISGGKGGAPYIFALAVFVAIILHIFYGIYRLDAARAGRKRRKQSA